MIQLAQATRRERQFHEAMHKMMGDLMPPLYPLPLRIKGGGSIDVLAVTHFDMVRVLRKNESYAQVSLLGNFDASVLAKYWEQLRMSESFRNSGSNMLDKYFGYRHETYPIILHSDGGQAYEDCSYTTFHWCTPFTYNMNPKDCSVKYHGSLVTEKLHA